MKVMRSEGEKTIFSEDRYIDIYNTKRHEHTTAEVVKITN